MEYLNTDMQIMNSSVRRKKIQEYFLFNVRYISDTSVHCMTISTTQWVTIPWHIPFCEWCPISPYGGALYYSQPAQNGYDMTIPIGGGATMEYTVEPNVNNRFDFEIAQISTGAQLRYAVVEDSMGVLREIASELITKRGSYSLSFRPTGNTVILQVSNEDLYNIVVFSAWNWFQTQTKTVQETILVDVCDEDKDRYRFGFNKGEKDNEWNGIGNHYEFAFRGYNPQTGRFNGSDPLHSKYPWNSTYAFAENDVIRSIDLEGLEKVTVTGNAIKIEGVKVVFTERPGATIDGREYSGGNIPYTNTVDLINKSYAELNKATSAQVYKLSMRRNPVTGEILGAYSNPETDKEYSLQYDIKVLQFKNEDEMRSSPAYNQALDNKSLMGMGLYGKDSYFENKKGGHKGIILPEGVGGKAVGDYLNTGYKATLIGPTNYNSGVTVTHEDGHNMGLSHINLGDEIGEMKGEYNSKGLMKGTHGPEPEKQEAPSNGMLIKMINTLPVQETK